MLKSYCDNVYQNALGGENIIFFVKDFNEACKVRRMMLEYLSDNAEYSYSTPSGRFFTIRSKGIKGGKLPILDINCFTIYETTNEHMIRISTNSELYNGTSKQLLEKLQEIINLTFDTDVVVRTE